MNQDYDFLFKLLLIGDYGVGKSCLVLRFADNIYNEAHITTIGVDFKIHYVDIDGSRIKLHIWDAHGGKKFREITSAYYRGVHGVLIVFDITDVVSFNDVKYWLNEITKWASKNVNKLLVGNKSDLDSQRAVTFEEGQEFAKSMGMEYIETSAKNSTNVDEAFLMLIRQINERMKPEPLSAASEGEGKNRCVCC
mmetsp:Transcript_17233/g.18702  ORF Transcript_17233/g.18702 Transcript_17233/m.18702 type:complete len:194 (+) Transcript_17233:40-621(+)